MGCANSPVRSMNRTGRAHYVGHNKVTRVPRTFIYLDSEAYRDERRYGESQRFRLAVAACDRRSHDTGRWRPREWGDFRSVHDCWAWIDSVTSNRGRTVVVAHNLAYDLRITDGFRQLADLGWQLVGVRLDGGQAWATWRRDGRTLACVDSMSWVPQSLEKLGTLVGAQKLPLPAWDDSDDAWLARCRRDVEILADVWRRLMAWVVAEDLGNWKPTGAGQAWAAFRHRFMSHQLLVHDDDEARDAERYAAHTGRCEAWRHGDLGPGPWYEYDYAAAYAHVGRDVDVPIKLLGEIRMTDVLRLTSSPRPQAFLCDVEVETNTPILPVRHDGRILWPVGRFRTTVWHNELLVAHAYGARIRPLRVWQYRTAPALRDFCAWVLDIIDPRNTSVDPVVKAAAKHWSRALIGRTAAQWSTWERWGRTPENGVGLSIAIDADAGERFRLLHVGHDLFRNTEVKENPDAMVAIMSYVMATSRVRLWEAIEHANPINVAYVDTDALIVNQRGADLLQRAQLPQLRIKSAWEHVEVLGPRQLILSGELKAAGVPRGAVRVDGETWEGDVWAALSTSLASGYPDRVSITRRRFAMRGTDRRRIHNDDGSTQPVRIDTTSDPSDIPATQSA